MPTADGGGGDLSAGIGYAGGAGVTDYGDSGSLLQLGCQFFGATALVVAMW